MGVRTREEGGKWREKTADGEKWKRITAGEVQHELAS